MLTSRIRRTFSAGLGDARAAASRLLDQLVDQLLVDREQQVFLLAHVVVQARLADPDLVGDLGHRGGVVAALANTRVAAAMMSSRTRVPDPGGSPGVTTPRSGCAWAVFISLGARFGPAAAGI